MKVKRIWCKDFLSFESIDYDIPEYPIRIQGVNKTDKNQESNGSGKSGLQNIFEYAVVSTNSRKENDKGLIRIGTASGMVGIEIECTMRQQVLKVERVIKKSGSKLSIEVNNEEISFSTMKDGNEYILDWLKMTKADIQSYYIINSERFKSFFHNSNKEKLDLIGRFIDTSSVDEAEPKVKKEIKELESKLSIQNKEKTKLEGRIEGADEDIDKLSDTSDNTNKEEIERLSRKVIALNESITENEASLVKLEAKLTSSEKSVEGFVASIDKLEEDFDDETYKATKDALEEIQSEQRTLNREILRIEAVCKGAIECPKCEHEFLLDPNADLSKLEVDVEVKRTELVDCKTDETETEELINEMKVSDLKIQSLKRELRTAESEVDRQKRKVRSVKQDINGDKDTVSLTEAKIETLKDTKGKDNTLKIKSLKLDKKGFQENINIIDAEIIKIEAEIFNVAQWETNFKRFKMYLANMAVQTVQTKCNANLNKMGSDLLVRIDAFKEKADGTFKEEITPVVLREEERTFFSYSGGERGRLVFAMILSIQEIINEQNPYGGLDFLSVDEVFEGIDGVGLHHLMKSIKNIGQSVLITTHITNELLTDDNIVTIEKVSGISRIK